MRHAASLVLMLLAGCGGQSEDVREEPPVDACAAVRCAAGTHCVAHGEQAECAPDEPLAPDDGEPTSSCAAVLCAVGTRCVETPSGARCEPMTAECQADTDCRKEENYCGGCHCLALARGETAPTCPSPVQCFAAPCSVTQGEPACVDGQCLLQ
jgi:hypothetical protein